MPSSNVITAEQIEAEQAFYDSFNSDTFDIERWPGWVWVKRTFSRILSHTGIFL
jgi:hypothetical protein